MPMLHNLIRNWIEYRGRQSYYDPPSFSGDQLVAQFDIFQVSTFIDTAFVPSFPGVCPIVISAHGRRFTSDGGCLDLPSGRYHLYYVDIREKALSLPDIRTITLDNVLLKIKAGIKYQVAKPELIFDIQDPMRVLYKDYDDALQQFFQNRNYQDLLLPTISEELIKHVRKYLPTKYFAFSNVSVSFHKIGIKTSQNQEVPATPERIINIFVGGNIEGPLTVGDNSHVNSLKVSGDVADSQIVAGNENTMEK